MFSEENKVPRKLFEVRKVAGSAKCKQSKTVCNCIVPFKVSSFYSVMRR